MAGTGGSNGAATGCNRGAHRLRCRRARSVLIVVFVVATHVIGCAGRERRGGTYPVRLGPGHGR